MPDFSPNSRHAERCDISSVVIVSEYGNESRVLNEDAPLLHMRLFLNAKHLVDLACLVPHSLKVSRLKILHKGELLAGKVPGTT